MKKIFGFFGELIKIVIISLVIVLPIRYFVIQPFIVRGASMEPNFYNGEYLIINEISYRFNKPERNDVVVFKFPQDPSQYYIKRIVGLPGELVKIENGVVKVLRDSQEIIIEEQYLALNTYTSGNTEINLNNDEYFVLGDHREASSDSRRWGTLDEKFIVGKVLLRAWPLEKMKVFANQH